MNNDPQNEGQVSKKARGGSLLKFQLSPTLSNFIKPASKKPAIDIAKNPLDPNGSDPWKDESRFNSVATRKEPRELTFSWLQLIIRCVFSFFRGKKGGKSFLSRGRKKDWRTREREILRKGLDRWLLASTRARLASKMSWWRGRIKEERGEGGTSRKPLRVLVSHLQI